PSVAGEVIGVRMGLQHADEPDVVMFRFRQHRLDVKGRVDDDRHTLVLVADEVTGAAQVVVQELLEEHGATLAPVTAMNPKAAPMLWLRPRPARAPRRAGAGRTSRSRRGRRASARRASG